MEELKKRFKGLRKRAQEAEKKIGILNEKRARAAAELARFTADFREALESEEKTLRAFALDECQKKDLDAAQDRARKAQSRENDAQKLITVLDEEIDKWKSEASGIGKEISQVRGLIARDAFSETLKKLQEEFVPEVRRAFSLHVIVGGTVTPEDFLLRFLPILRNLGGPEALRQTASSISKELFEI